MPQNWLITGGCGLTGTALISSILQEIPGARIRVLDNLSGGSREDLAKVCDYEETWNGVRSQRSEVRDQRSAGPEVKAWLGSGLIL